MRIELRKKQHFRTRQQAPANAKMRGCRTHLLPKQVRARRVFRHDSRTRRVGRELAFRRGHLVTATRHRRSHHVGGHRSVVRAHLSICGEMDLGESRGPGGIPWIARQPFAPWAFTFGLSAIATSFLRFVERGATGPLRTGRPLRFHCSQSRNWRHCARHFVASVARTPAPASARAFDGCCGTPASSAPGPIE